jgi:hypothetical protein
LAGSLEGRFGGVAEPIYCDEPPIARRLFASTGFAWRWLVLRLYLGWEPFVSGWGKTFSGQITWKLWQWAESQYSVTGTADCGWIRACVVEGQTVQRGSAVQALPAPRLRTPRVLIQTWPIPGMSTF